MKEKIFRLVADVNLTGENIDDVFYKIGRYYMDLYNDTEPESIFIAGKIEIKPIETYSNGEE